MAAAAGFIDYHSQAEADVQRRMTRITPESLPRYTEGAGGREHVQRRPTIATLATDQRRPPGRPTGFGLLPACNYSDRRDFAGRR